MPVTIHPISLSVEEIHLFSLPFEAFICHRYGFRDHPNGDSGCMSLPFFRTYSFLHLTSPFSSILHPIFPPLPSSTAPTHILENRPRQVISLRVNRTRNLTFPFSTKLFVGAVCRRIYFPPPSSSSSCCTWAAHFHKSRKDAAGTNRVLSITFACLERKVDERDEVN